MQVNGHDMKAQAQEQRIAMRRTADALNRLVKSPDWQVMVAYLNHRGQVLMNSLLSPTTGGDGMAIALSAERNKGALQEIQAIPQYIASIIQQDAQARKSEGAADDEVAPKTPAPKSEAEMFNPAQADRAEPVEETK